ncbi:MAG: hypothetical protein ACRC0X_02250 [Brevinema sp.]
MKKSQLALSKELIVDNMNNIERTLSAFKELKDLNNNSDNVENGKNKLRVIIYHNLIYILLQCIESDQIERYIEYIMVQIEDIDIEDELSKSIKESIAKWESALKKVKKQNRKNTRV